MRDLVATQHGEHVRLILVGVDRAVQLWTSGSWHDLCVVPGAHRVESEGDSTVEYRRKLDPLVTPQTRVGGAPRCVLSEEVVDHLSTELLRHVPYVVRHIEDVGYPTCVPGVFEAAAPARARPERLWVAAERQVDGGDLVTFITHSRGGHR